MFSSPHFFLDHSSNLIIFFCGFSDRQIDKIAGCGIPPNEAHPSCPLIYVVKEGGWWGQRKEKVCAGVHRELARCWEDHKGCGGKLAVMWRPADTHGHHLLSLGGKSGVLLTGKPRPSAE